MPMIFVNPRQGQRDSLERVNHVAARWLTRSSAGRTQRGA